MTNWLIDYSLVAKRGVSQRNQILNSPHNKMNPTRINNLRELLKGNEEGEIIIHNLVKL